MKIKMRGITLLSGLAAVIIGSVAASQYHVRGIDEHCYSSSAQLDWETTEKGSIDQVFRDHDGWRLYSHDTGDGLVKEERFQEEYRYLDHNHILSSIPEARGLKAPGHGGGLVIFKDLPEGGQPNAVIVVYTLKDCDFSFKHGEVHLPLDRGISPGKDYNGDVHNPKHPPMQEIH
ncbi:MAG: hypothetical protein AABX37_01515 [Nanoarchaeota archaeon]